jgi:hypothetical protein
MGDGLKTRNGVKIVLLESHQVWVARRSTVRLQRSILRQFHEASPDEEAKPGPQFVAEETCRRAQHMYLLVTILV